MNIKRLLCVIQQLALFDDVSIIKFKRYHDITDFRRYGHRSCRLIGTDSFDFIAMGTVAAVAITTIGMSLILEASISCASMAWYPNHAAANYGDD
ncbi:MAG: hypothetical protein ACRC6S_10450 [Shewanella sp.]